MVIFIYLWLYLSIYGYIIIYLSMDISIYLFYTCVNKFFWLYFKAGRPFLKSQITIDKVTLIISLEKVIKQYLTS